MLSLRTRAKQHDDEIVCKCWPSSASYPIPTSPGGEPRTRSRWSFVRRFHTLIPVNRSSSQTLNRLRGTFRTRRIPFQSRVYQSSQRFWWYLHQYPKETPGTLLAHLHPHSHLVSSFPARVPVPVLAAPISQSSHPSLAVLRPITTSRVSASGSGTWSWSLRFSCSTSALEMAAAPP